jgi:hypothetical protein
MKKARAAWDNGDFDEAPGLYESALSAGGLPSTDVLDAFVHIGSSLAISGKTHAAIAAFRYAALVNAGFQVPGEAGRKAVAAAEKARRDQRKVGSIGLTAQAPDEVDSGSAFGVDVTLGPPHAPLVDSVWLLARDPLAGRTYEQQAPAGPSIHFDVPARMTLPDATLLLHLEVRDAHSNQLASVEQHVHVAKVVSAAVATPFSRPGSNPSRERPAPSTARRGGGFWSSPWPYVIGGAALAAGGAAIFFATRPGDEVSIGSPRVESH